MTIDLGALSPDERAEWSALLSDALNGSRSADAAAVTRAEAALADAQRAGCDWPAIVTRQMVRAQLRLQLKGVAKSESMVSVSYNGRIVAKTARRGVRARDAAGVQYHQQKLIEDMTWDEFDEWAAMNDAQINGLLVNRHMAKLLMRLHQSHATAATVRDALKAADTTLDELLADAA